MRYGTINNDYWKEDAIDIDELCGSGIGNAIMHYVKTCPASNMLGVYPIAIETISRRVNLGHDNFLRAFNILCSNGYIMYDNKYEYIWVVNLAFEQTFPGLAKKDYQNAQLAEKDSRVTAMNEILESLPRLCFAKELIDKYQWSLRFKSEIVNGIIDNSYAVSHPPSHPPSTPLPPPPSHPLDDGVIDGGITGGVGGGLTPVNSKQKTVNSNTDISNDISRAASSAKNSVQKKRKPKFSQKELEIGAEVVQFLVDITGKNFSLHERHYEHIAKRVREGVSVDDMKKVIVFKSKQWLYKESFSGNLNPATLFRDRNFRGYLDEANGEGAFIKNSGGVKEVGLTMAQMQARQMDLVTGDDDDE